MTDERIQEYQTELNELWEGGSVPPSPQKLDRILEMLQQLSEWTQCIHDQVTEIGAAILGEGEGN